MTNRQSAGWKAQEAPLRGMPRGYLCVYMEGTGSPRANPSGSVIPLRLSAQNIDPDGLDDVEATLRAQRITPRKSEIRRIHERSRERLDWADDDAFDF